MQFKEIMLFSLNDYNDNKEKKGYFPQEGFVINVFFHNNHMVEMVAVGFLKKIEK